ncbi:transposase [Streptomyces sp. NPDC079020]|uniref:transposase n=1 Tax=Streptomyces sp. NPDC079020 TaxID=3365722 RepID=UPI0037CF61C4
MPERRTRDYIRNGLTTLFAAFDVATGEVITSLHRRYRAAEFKKFLIKIEKEVHGHLQVHLICDNHGAHKTPAIRAWPAGLGGELAPYIHHAFDAPGVPRVG